MSNVRIVKRNEEVRTGGSVKFKGKLYEPAYPNSMISPGSKVEVVRAGKFQGEHLITVRKVYPGGHLGGEETWEQM
jgi:hypothetical protein